MISDKRLRNLEILVDGSTSVLKMIVLSKRSKWKHAPADLGEARQRDEEYLSL